MVMTTIKYEQTQDIPSHYRPTSLPDKFSLLQNYPNPFNARTTIQYTLAEESHVKLRVYNLLGQQVATLVNGLQPADEYNVSWETKTATSGIYIIHLEAQDFTLMRKMLLLK